MFKELAECDLEQRRREVGERLVETVSKCDMSERRRKRGEGTVEVASKVEVGEFVGQVGERFVECVGEVQLEDRFEVDGSAEVVYTTDLGRGVVCKEGKS